MGKEGNATQVWQLNADYNDAFLSMRVAMCNLKDRRLIAIGNGEERDTGRDAGDGILKPRLTKETGMELGWLLNRMITRCME